MNFIKSAVFKILSQKVLAPASTRFIFVYHDVSDPGSPQYSDLYSTDIRVFQEQIDFIKKNFETVSLDEILASSNNGKVPLAAITFDDGFLSVKEAAMPYLAARRIPFTVFLNSAAIRENHLPYDQFAEINREYGERVYLNAEEIKELHEKGVAVGSHTSSHQTLSKCDEQMLRREVVDNKLFLENIIKDEVSHLAIPYGKREHYNETALDFCKAAGHKFIYSTNPVYFKGAWSENESKPIPRIGLTNQSAAELCFLVNRPLVKKIDI